MKVTSGMVVVSQGMGIVLMPKQEAKNKEITDASNHRGQ